MPISSKIKQRLNDADHRYWAGDNISEYIMDGEHEELIAELTEKFEDAMPLSVATINSRRAATTMRLITPCQQTKIEESTVNKNRHIISWINV